MSDLLYILIIYLTGLPFSIITTVVLYIYNSVFIDKDDIITIIKYIIFSWITVITFICIFLCELSVSQAEYKIKKRNKLPNEY